MREIDELPKKAREAWLESEVRIRQEASKRLATKKGTVVQWVDGLEHGLFARVQLHRPVKRIGGRRNLFLVHIRNLVFLRVGKEEEWQERL